MVQIEIKFDSNNSLNHKHLILNINYFFNIKLLCLKSLMTNI